MENLIELYEMVSLNEATLRGGEKAAILSARRALAMFERAMKSFARASAEAEPAAAAGSLLAA